MSKEEHVCVSFDVMDLCKRTTFWERLLIWLCTWCWFHLREFLACLSLHSPIDKFYVCSWCQSPENHRLWTRWEIFVPVWYFSHRLACHRTWGSFWWRCCGNLGLWPRSENLSLHFWQFPINSWQVAIWKALYWCRDSAVVWWNQRPLNWPCELFFFQTCWQSLLLDDLFFPFRIQIIPIPICPCQISHQNSFFIEKEESSHLTSLIRNITFLALLKAAHLLLKYKMKYKMSYPFKHWNHPFGLDHNLIFTREGNITFMHGIFPSWDPAHANFPQNQWILSCPWKHT